MKNLFEHTSSPWIRYSSYEYRTAEDGTLYIVVSADAKPEMYNPMKDAESLVLAAVNIGLQVMHKAPEDELKSMVLRFINSYGFLGFMTALPTTAEFITYESVYLPKNHFIKEESLSTESYLDYFYPFDKMDFHKKGVESSWSVSDKDGIAIALATGKNPQAVTMSFQKEYAERYDWLVKEFSDWAFTFTTSFLYYLDYDRLDEQTKNLYRQGMSAFGGISPTYHISLAENAQFANSSSVRALSSRRLIANARASLCSIVFSLEESLYSGIKFCLRKAFSSSYFGNLISP